MSWDVFISHAREDKESVVLPLARFLEDRGLSVWVDKFQLKLGDPLRRSIEEGIRSSRYGIVILSPSFFSKDWPQRELDGLFSLEEAIGEKRILPVWHLVRFADVAQRSPFLAQRLAISTEDGIAAVGEAILEVIVPRVEVRGQFPGQYAPSFSFSVERVTGALHAHELLARPSSWPSLRILREGWMGTDDSVLIEILYLLMAPLVELYCHRYLWRRSLALWTPRERLLFGLFEAAYNCLFDDDLFASIKPSIEYTPRVPNWRQKRKVKPERYWWQGISVERFEDSVKIFVQGDSLEHWTLRTKEDFATIYRAVYNSPGDSRQQVIGLAGNALYGFTPKERPVYWRSLVTQVMLYRLMLKVFSWPEDEVTAQMNQLGGAFESLEGDQEEPERRLDSASLFELAEVTCEVAKEYLRSIVLPRVRLRLSSSQER